MGKGRIKECLAADAPVTWPRDETSNRLSIDDLYRQHAAELCTAVLRRFGAGPPDPEDVVHAAFVRYAKIEDTSKIKNTRAFLYTITRNIVLDHKRHEKRTEAFVDEVLRDAGHSVETLTPEDVLEQREQFDIMVAAMKTLPKAQRQVIAMNRLEGKTYNEIAAATGWSTAKISRQIKHGVDAINAALLRANATKRRRGGS